MCFRKRLLGLLPNVTHEDLFEVFFGFSSDQLLPYLLLLVVKLIIKIHSYFDIWIFPTYFPFTSSFISMNKKKQSRKTIYWQDAMRRNGEQISQSVEVSRALKSWPPPGGKASSSKLSESLLELGPSRSQGWCSKRQRRLNF